MEDLHLIELVNAVVNAATALTAAYIGRTLRGLVRDIREARREVEEMASED